MLVSPAPHLHTNVSTRSLMRDVIIALAPAIIVSVLFYGWSELLVLSVSVASCVFLEWAITKYLLKAPSTVGDLSAVVTGLLLAMNLPCTTPVWVVFVGAVIAIGVAKMSFGGIGQNVFNPAITARVFLLISFPSIMTDWTVPQGFIHSTDAVSGATLLGRFSEGGVEAIIIGNHDLFSIPTEANWDYEIHLMCHELGMFLLLQNLFGEDINDNEKYMAMESSVEFYTLQIIQDSTTSMFDEQIIKEYHF